MFTWGSIMKELEKEDFIDLSYSPSETDYGYTDIIPKLTERNILIIIDKINELIKAINKLSEKL